MPIPSTNPQQSQIDVNNVIGNRQTPQWQPPASSTGGAMPLEQLENQIRNIPASKTMATETMVAPGLVDITGRYPTQYVGFDNEALYNKSQGFVDNILSGVLGAASKTGMYFAKNVGYLGGLIGNVNKLGEIGNKYQNWGEGIAAWISAAGDNALVNYANKQVENIENRENPVYRDPADASQGFWYRAVHDDGFWTHDFLDAAAYAVSAAATGAPLATLSVGTGLVTGLSEASAWGRNVLGLAEAGSEALGAEALTGSLEATSASAKGYEGLNSMARLVKGIDNAKIARGLDMLTVAAINTPGEAMSEAMDSKKTIIAKLKADPANWNMSDEEIDKIASQGAKNVFVDNLAILSLSNLFDANLFVKRLPSTSSAFKDFIEMKAGAFGIPELKKFNRLQRSLRLGKEWGEGFLKEGYWEENLQLATQRMNEEQATDPKQRAQLFNIGFAHWGELATRGMGQAADATMGKDPEASTSIALGGLLGMGESIAFGRKKIRQREEALKGIQTAVTNASNSFLAMKEMYKKEKFVNDKGEEQERYVVENGRLVPDEDLMNGKIAQMSKTIELTDLMHNAGDSREYNLKELYENELFARLALSHFEAGIGDKFIERLNDVNRLSNEDMIALGYDPNSKQQAAQKVELFKQKALKLEKLYNDVQGNIMTGFRESPMNFSNRRGEIFRLAYRQMTLDDMIAKNTAQVNELNGYLMGQGTPSPTQGIVHPLNQLIANQRNAQKVVNEFELDAINRKTNNQWHDEQALTEARKTLEDANNALDKAETDLEQNSPDVHKMLKKDDDGYYKYDNALDNLMQTKNLKIAQIKQAELNNSRNSVIQRLSLLSDFKKGPKFYKEYQEAMPPEEQFVEPRVKKRVGDATLKQYTQYETERLRGVNIKTQYDDIIREFRTATALKDINKQSLDELSQNMDNLLENNVPLGKDDMKLLKDSVTDKIGPELKSINDDTAKLKQERYDINANPEAFHEGFEDYVLSTAQQQRIREIDAQLADLDARSQTLSEIKDKADTFKEHVAEEISPDSLRRSVADEQFADADRLTNDVENVKQTGEGYDTQDDLDAINDELSQLTNLKNIFQQRPDLLSTKEFKGFMDRLNDTLDKLADASKLVEKRVDDRKAKEARVRRNNVISLGHSIGLDIVNKKSNNLYDTICNMINGYFPDDLAKIKGKEDKLFYDDTVSDVEREGHLKAVHDLLKNSYNAATEKQKEEFIAKLQEQKKEKLDQVKENTIYKRARHMSAGSEKVFDMAYERGPEVMYGTYIVKRGMDRENKFDFIKGKSLYKFVVDRDIVEYRANVEKESRVGSTISKEEVLAMIDSHVEFVALKKLEENIESNISNLNQSNSELKISNDNKELITPSSQQRRSLNELVSFYFAPKDNEKLYSVISYLRGPAGSGKSQMVGKWLPKLLNLNNSQIYAIGHNASSSRTINEILGKKDTAPNLQNLIDSLSVSDEHRLIIVDEISGFSRDELNLLAQKIQDYNRNKPQEKQARAVFMGDPNQLSIEKGQLVETPDVEIVNVLPEKDPASIISKFNMTYISPLTIKYRSNVSQISNFSDKFINQSKDLSKENIIVKSNNPTLDPAKMDNLTGVVGTTNFDNDVVKILSNVPADGKTRAIITSPSKVADYQKLLQDKGLADKAEVLSYIDAQGRTIDEVYINIKPNDEQLKDNVDFLNKANYVATSRATNFIMMANMDIRNEQDLDIEKAKAEKEGEVKDMGKEFRDNVTTEIASIKSLMTEQTAKVVEDSTFNADENEDPEEAKKEGEEEPLENEDLADSTSEGFKQEDQPEADPEDLSDDEVTTEQSTSMVERVNAMSDEVKIDPKTQFGHNFDYPTSLATKNFVLLKGVPTYMSDKQLQKAYDDNAEVEVTYQSLKPKDKLMYVPFKNEKGQQTIQIYTPAKGDNGKVIPGEYRQVAVLSDAEIKAMGQRDDTKHLHTLFTQDYQTFESTADIQDKIYKGDLSGTTITTAIVGDASHVKYVYNPSKYQKFSLSGIVNTFMKAFYDAPTQDEINEAQTGAKVIIFNVKDELPLYKGIRRGEPYLMFKGADQPGGAQTQYVRLDRRIISNKNKGGHLAFIKPMIDFINNVKGYNKFMKDIVKSEDYKYGTVKGNRFIHNVSTSKDPSAILSKMGIDNTATQQKVKAAVDRIYNAYIKKPTPEDFKRSDGVTILTRKDKDGNPVKGIVMKVNTIEKNGEQIPETASIGFNEVDADGKTVFIEHDYDFKDLDLDYRKTGEAVKVMNDLWSSNKSITKKAKLPGIVADEEKGIVLAPSLLLMGDKDKPVTTEQLESWFSFGKDGQHAGENEGNKFSFRIPIPRNYSPKDPSKTSVNFTDSVDNSTKNPHIVDYYLQSNFEGLQKTQISAVHERPPGYKEPAPEKREKKKKPEPTRPTPAVTKYGLSIEEKEVPVVFGAGTETEYRVKVGNKIVGGFKTRTDAESRLNEIIKTLDDAIITKPVNLGDGVSVKGLTIDGTQYAVLNIHSRPVTLVDIDGVTVPFYMTTGLGGKNLKPGWYPMFGYSTHGWLNKTRGEDMKAYYERLLGKDNASVLQKAAEKLNDKYGTDPNSILETGVFSAKQVHDAVNNNLDFTPVEHTDDANRMGIDPQAEYERLKANIRSIGDKLSAATGTDIVETPTGTEAAPPASAVEDVVTPTEPTEPVEPVRTIKEGSNKKSGRGGLGRKKALAQERASAEELGAALTHQQVINLVQQKFPTFSAAELKDKVKFVGEAEMMRISMGNKPWGLFKDNVIYLKKNPDGTVYTKVVQHEVFHAIYNNYLTEKERNTIADIIKRENPKTRFLSDDDFDHYVDEYLAGMYMEREVPKGVNSFIKMVMNKIRNFFRFVSPNIETLDQLFDLIDQGYITTRFKSEGEMIDNYINTSLEKQTIQQNCY
jgi:AAA domain